MDKYDSRYNRSQDVEISHEVTPDTVWVEEPVVEKSNNGARALGIVSLALSILSFFFLNYSLAPAGIILGVVGVKKGSSLGWWGIVLGVLAIVVTLTIGLVTLPFRLFS